MKYATIKTYDVANGPGVRVSLYVSGCNHHCKGCFNPETWDFNYGKEFTQDTINTLLNAMDKEYIDGITILGGEPLDPVNQKEVANLISQVKQRYPNKSIWCFTGFDFEKEVMEKMYKKFDTTKQIIDNLDVLVDGEFKEDKKNLSLRFRGSENQRIIDVKKTLNSDHIIWKELEN